MKKTLFLAAILLIASTAVLADTTFYSQPWDGSTTGRCDANTPTCGSTGWTVYDNFAVPNNINKITDFTVTDFLFSGSLSDYISTNWTLFGPNAANPFGTPTYSGTAVGAVTDLGGGFFQLSFTGLNIPVTAGNWILGFQNNMSNPTDITTRGESGVGDGIYWQQDNTGGFQFTLFGNTAFSVSGTNSSSVPEPASLLMLGSGLLGLGGMARKRMKKS